MELTPELIGTGVVGILIIAGAVGNYLRTLKIGSPKPEPIRAGFSMGWFDSEQTIKLLALETRQAVALERIADALAIIADRERADMKDTLETIVDQLRQPRPRPRLARKAK